VLATRASSHLAAFLWNISTGSALEARTIAILQEGHFMEDAGIGWIAAIIIGGIAGWLAEQFMKSNMGVLMNVILGIIGAVVANVLLGLLGVSLGGWLGYLVAGFIGACILIAIARAVRR
jgi:uncharacterized membrane protein YeaQ/YmgE (transglycosylase-associated protein family)